MKLVSNSSSYNSSVSSDSAVDVDNAKHGKAALYIAIALVAAVIFTGLLVASGGGVVIAGFMFSIGLAVDAVAILVGVIFLAIFAAFMCYETYRCSKKAHKALHPPGTQLSTSSTSL